MSTTTVAGTVAAFLVLAAAAGADAQGSGGAAGGAAKVDAPNAGSPLPGGGTTKDLTKPGQGGVAGTGLGGSTNGSGNGATAGKTSGDTDAAGVPGTGRSVDGPAGQGIDGQGTSKGIDVGGSGAKP